MKKSKIALAIGAVLSLSIGGYLFASDHIDAPAVKTHTTDLTDLYVFNGSNTANLVFVANIQGLLAPGATAAAAFDPDVLIQFNIDNNGDNIEDLVIQGVVVDGKMNIYGPIAPSISGLRSKIEGAITASVAVTAYGSEAVTSTSGSGISVFAGPRDDPFFFDLDQYHKIIAGTATSFNNPGVDAFAGTNVLSLVVEVPKTMLNSTGKLNVWLTTKKKAS